MWAFQTEHKPKFINVVNPAFVFGPAIHQVLTPDDLSSLGFLYAYITGAKREVADLVASLLVLLVRRGT